MYRIEVQREKEVKNVKWKGKTENSTLGTLRIIDATGKIVYTCKTMENGGPSTDTPNQDKRIVAREYRLKTRGTGVCIPAKYNKQGIWIVDPNNPNFEKRFIMIHIANGPQDIEGCLGLGKTFSTSIPGLVNSSKIAVTEFYDFIHANGGVSNFILVIKEING